MKKGSDCKLLAYGNCNLTDLLSLNCIGRNECKVLGDLIDKIKRHVEVHKKNDYTIRICICPCDPNLKDSFSFLCKDQESTKKVIDMIFLVEKLDENRRSIKYCYMVEIKNSISPKKRIATKTDIEEKFYSGVDCNECCNELSRRERVVLSAKGDSEMPNGKLKQDLRKERIKLVSPDEFAIMILTGS